MMPVIRHQIEGGALVLLFTCERCGEPASHGEDVDLLRALRTGDARHGGKWWCGRRTDGTLYCKHEANS